MSEKIGILGAGGQSDEAESYIRDTNVVFRAVTHEFAHDGSGLVDMDGLTSEQIDMHVIAAVGSPKTKRDLVAKWPGEKFTSVISEVAYIDPSTTIGEGCIIGPRAVLTTNIEVGSHVLVNVAATVSHDCRVGDYVTISPGAHIGGKVRIGDGAFIGIGAVVTNEVSIASGVVLGAGAVLISDADVENGVYVGSPARLIKVNEDWLSEI